MNVVKEIEKPKKDSKNLKKELSKRDRANEFAKQIKKPVKPSKSVFNNDVKANNNIVDHMAYLEEQHRLYQEKVKELTHN